ncbi:MAG: FAD binding domain-containing protein [Pseudomonadota bacterium]
MHYLRPKDLSDALSALAYEEWRVAAGCTDLFPATEAKTLPGRVLDITDIEDLRGIRATEDGWSIGATTTWTDLIRADLPPAFRSLQLAAREVGATQIQNRGTLAGNLCNASPAADGVPPLQTLEAEVELRSARGVRRVPLAAFLLGPRQTDRRSDELLTAVHIPAEAAKGRGHFLKLGARRYLVISIAMCAVRLECQGGIVTAAALSVGACGPVAARLPLVEAALVGHPPDPDRVRQMDVGEALRPIEDVRADAGFRTAAATELVRRCVGALAGREAAAA